MDNYIYFRGCQVTETTVTHGPMFGTRAYRYVREMSTNSERKRKSSLFRKKRFALQKSQKSSLFGKTFKKSSLFA
jgi:hypothetical protein